MAAGCRASFELLRGGCLTLFRPPTSFLNPPPPWQSRLPVPDSGVAASGPPLFFCKQFPASLDKDPVRLQPSAARLGPAPGVTVWPALPLGLLRTEPGWGVPPHFPLLLPPPPRASFLRAGGGSEQSWVGDTPRILRARRAFWRAGAQLRTEGKGNSLRDAGFGN